MSIIYLNPYGANFCCAQQNEYSSKCKMGYNADLRQINADTLCRILWEEATMKNEKAMAVVFVRTRS